MRLATKSEITRTIAAIQEQGLNVREVSFDDNGNPVIKCVEDVDNQKMVIDNINNKRIHDIKNIDEWKSKRNANHAQRNS